MTTTTTASETPTAAALDARVRELVRWHFDPATGGDLFEPLYARRAFQRVAAA